MSLVWGTKEEGKDGARGKARKGTEKTVKQKEGREEGEATENAADRSSFAHGWKTLGLGGKCVCFKGCSP